MRMKKFYIIIAALIAVSAASAQDIEATSYTKAFNDSVAKIAESFGNQDFEDAKRGFIATFDDKTDPVVNGKKLYDLHTWDFLKGNAPATVNPVLWRQAQLNSLTGLFEVIPNKIYQVRGFDIANVTFVRSDNGYIVIDASTTEETAAAALSLIKKYVGDAPIKAIIITHSHADHFGGVKGILDNASNKGENIPIIAPKDYFTNSVNENVLAAIPMFRHSGFMFGFYLPRNAKGFVTSGLGSGVIQNSYSASIPPATKEISENEESLTIDGLQLDFRLALNSEAPSEMLIYIPKYNALQSAEDINHTLHNLLTPRGAKIRNGLLWSKYIDGVIEKYGKTVDVSLGSHHWPVWGNKNVVTYWEKQRDLYRYIHDQTLYLANKGYTPNEISNIIKLPQSQASYSASREYYGTVSFNARSQYELYFGFFDGNPVNLDPLSPVEESKKIIEAIGGAGKALDIAQTAYNKGDYRWAADLLNKVVFADASNSKAKDLLAQTYSQLGYQAESAPWRDFYLQGAKELKDGVPNAVKKNEDNRDYSAITPSLYFDVIATRIDGYKNDASELGININFTDTGDKASLIFKNGALSNRVGSQLDNPDATINADKKIVYALFSKKVSLDSLLSSGNLTVEGDKDKLASFISKIETPSLDFNIVEP